MKITIDAENIFKHAIKNDYNLFLGAGFSVLANSIVAAPPSSNERPLPTGEMLKLELLETFKRQDLSGLELPQIAQILQGPNPDRFFKYLRSRFRVSTFDNRYTALLQNPPHSIITTNIDNLPNRLFDGSECYLNDVTKRGSAYKDRRAVNFVPLHGHILDQENNFIFSTLDLSQAFSRDPDLFGFMTQALQDRPTLFWGYGMKDAAALQALHPNTTNNRPHKDKWIAIRNQEPDQIEFLRAIGFKIAVGSTDDILEYFQQVTAPASKSIQPTIFHPDKEEAIPTLSDVPASPIEDFYRGAPPRWSQILVSRIPTTSYYDTARNAILGGRNVLIMGIPFSGKTTLLMQLAAQLDTPHTKLFLEHLPADKARSLARRANGASVIVFLDQAADAADGINELLKHKNIQIVACDRYHNFELSRHIVSRQKFSTINVSELTPEDIGRIYQNIPGSIRQPTLIKPETASNAQLCLFEFIEANVKGRTLKERCADFLHQLAGRSSTMHDLLAMICYVAQCRTPVSFDLASSFLGSPSDYRDVYKKLNAFATLVLEHEITAEGLGEADQDHFLPRSALFSDAIVANVTQLAFRRMFDKFHAISPARIPYFDVFSRYGYDADYARKAFSNWRDGRDFYMRIYRRDRNYYIKQQAAIYLSKKKVFPESFQLIDEALVESRGKVPSIRHTHAVIIFEANIDHANGGEDILKQLKNSMKILEECHSYDKRKTYHAYKFGEQAVRFFDVYPTDDSAAEFLIKARDWLSEELNREAGLYGVRRILREVQSRAAQLVGDV